MNVPQLCGNADSIASARDLRDQVWQHLVSDRKPCHLDRVASQEITLEQP